MEKHLDFSKSRQTKPGWGNFLTRGPQWVRQSGAAADGRSVLVTLSKEEKNESWDV